MRLCVLFSGGKDSTLALLKAMEKEEVVCLVSLISKNRESYMFHTPNIELTQLQAEAIGLPLILKSTEGKQEEELEDLKDAIREAKSEFRIDGVVTGAIESVYQTKRIQKICGELGLCCLNPLWKRDQQGLLKEIVGLKFEVMITGVFAYPFDRSWLGKRIDGELVDRLVRLQREYGVSPSGEGGEIETTVLDAPIFRKKLQVLESTIDARGYSGFLIIKAKLSAKQ